MTIIIYLLKAQIVFTILFMVYYAFLRKEKFLALNRFILIGVIALAFILPVSRTFNIGVIGIHQLQPQVKPANSFPKYSVSSQLVQKFTPTASPVRPVDYVKLVVPAYLIVSAILLILLLLNLYKVYAVIKMSNRHKASGLVYCEPFYETAPFSFFNFIVVSKSTFSPGEYGQVIAHENAHCRQLHSFDVLLADLACIILWINPLVYLYRRQLKLNLEFLADEAALNAGIDALNYQLSLLQHTAALKTYQPVNAFFTSKIKERIVMINTAKPAIRNRYKYVFLAPLVLLLWVLVGFQKGPVVTKEPGLLNNSTGALAGKFTMPAEVTPAEKGNLSNPVVNRPIVSAKEFCPAQEHFNVFMDGRTDTVKFSLVPDSINRKFEGIYVIGNKILSDDEIRAAIKYKGKFEMVLANRPVIGIYTANDSTAIKRWGERARPGVVFAIARPEKQNQ